MSFESSMAGAGVPMRDQANKLRRALAFSFLRDMLQDPRSAGGIGTPRDTSRAVSGWTISAGSERRYDPGEGRHSAPNAADAGRAIGDPPLEQTIFVTDAVPYIGVLAGGRRMGENGRMVGSEQAPGPFVEQALEKIERLFRGTVERG